MSNSLWDDIEDVKENDSFEKEGQNFNNKEYRTFLLNELFENFSKNLKNISSEDKEKLLEIFTENSQLLNSTNSYLKNPIKGMRLISTIISSTTNTNKSNLERYLDDFNQFLENDFIEFSNQITISNEAELYNTLLNIRDELQNDIKFSELVNKTHIGIGGSFSAGKSSFLNSILEQNNNDDDILPIDSVPTTSIPTFIVKKNKINSSSKPIDIFTFNKNGQKAKIDKESLLAISHEFNKIYKFGLTSIINKIVVELKNTPYENIAFLDTPGYSKADGEENIDKNLAKNHLTNINAMIWLIDIDNGIIRNGDIQFIKSLNFDGDILFVVNKADKKPKNDIENILDAIKATLDKSYIKYVDVVAYSSHEKEEYFSKNIIDNFLNSKDKAKVVNFEKKVMAVFNEYQIHINKVDNKNKKLLKLFNQIDLYGGNFVSTLDDFDVILSTVKKDTDKNQKDRDLYNKNNENAIRLISLIDNEFNQNISIGDKFQAGKYNDVLDFCNQKITKDIYDLKYYLLRAKCHYNLKNYEKAILDYTKVIRISDENLSLIYKERANAYLQLSNYQQALLDYKKTLQLSPNNKSIKETINTLQKALGK